MHIVQNKAQGSFTMIELMIVIGVIAILISLLYTVTTSIPENARNNQAKTEVRSIAIALKAYKVDNGKWPNQTQGETDTTYFANNYLVIRELIGKNPRSKIYLEIPTNRLDPSSNYFDPWGTPYVICMDENGDNELRIEKFEHRAFKKRVYAEAGKDLWREQTNSLDDYVGVQIVTNGTINYFLIKDTTADAGSFKNSTGKVQIVSWRER
jgi:prepilin-type N-terminal cleavage/methylation domain-containing protein